EPLLYINGQGQVEGSIIRDRYTLLAVAAWAPFEWLQIGAEVPYILDQTGMNLIAQGVPPPLRRAFGAPTASVRWGILHQRKGAAADVSLQAGVRPPWSSDNAYIDGGMWSVAPRLSFGRSFDMVRAGMEVGVVYMPHSALPPGVRNHLMFGGVVSTGAPDGLRLELSARTTMTRDFNLGAVEVLAGARMPVGPMELFAVGGPGLGQREESPGTPEWRVIVGMTFGNGLVRGETQTQELTPTMPAPAPAPTAPSDAPPPTGG
ncbi:MAG TPA: hypothetical protein VFV33_10625, partial [Gemmatimonadaceae bacterium]|nr:hypothetical protein [Gemmatimonadaceae bacterium]